MKRLLFLFILLPIIFTCEPLPSRLDPDSPDFLRPNFTVDTKSSEFWDGDTVSADTVHLSLRGNLISRQVSSFRHLLDDGEWTDWEIIDSGTYEFELADLSEGLHTLTISVCYDPEVDVIDSTITFFRAKRPSVTENEETKFSIEAGAPCTLRVMAEGTGDLEFAWYHDSVLIENATEGVLVLDTVTSVNAGVYYCRISNTWGETVSPQMQLQVVYRVIYKGNGNTEGEAPVDTNRYDSDTVAPLLDNNGNLTRRGYTFGGWSLSADGSGDTSDSLIDFSDATENVTIYAVWIPNPTHTLLFNANGASWGETTDTVQQYRTGELMTIPGTGDKLVNSGATFTGWNTEPDGSGTQYGENDELEMIDRDITLYAQWTLHPTYTVTYEGNGAQSGEVPIDTKRYEAGATVTIAGNSGKLEKAGNTFTGWNSEMQPEDVVAYTPGATFVMKAANITLFAAWTTKHTYTLMYLGGDSTTGTPPDPVSNITGTTVAVAGQKTLLRKGHTFTGWNTAANGDGKLYEQNALFTIGEEDDTLYAQWEAATYSLTYNGNGSDGGDIPGATNHTYGSEITISATVNLSRIGYSFAGWNTAADSTRGESYATGSTFRIPDSNVTLYARWSVNAYTITYHGNDNTRGEAPDAVTTNYNEPVVLAGQDSLERNGYNFSGWNTQADGKGGYYPAETTMLMGAQNIELYALWMPDSFTVTFVGNSENVTGTMVPQTIVGDSTERLAANLFVRTGFAFVGWSHRPDGDVEYVDKAGYTMGFANDTLYAQWTDDYQTVTFDKNSADATGEMAPQNISSNTAALLAANEFVKVGWMFSGWSTSTDGAVVYADEDQFLMGTDDDTLYAQWTKNSYKLSYSGNGSTGGSVQDTADVPYGDVVTVALQGNLLRTGHTFAGWNTAHDGSGTDQNAGAEITMGAASVTLYAKWTKNSYMLSYNGNGFTGGTVPDSAAIPYGDIVTVAVQGTMVRSGHTFTGWNTLVDGNGNSWAPGSQPAMGAAAVKLYAQWTVLSSYTVTFNGNGTGVQGTMAPQTIVFGTSANLTANVFSRTGYTFTGWSTTVAGNVAYQNAESYTMNTEGATLYAVWTTLPTYTITYTNNSQTDGTLPASQTKIQGIELTLAYNSGNLVRTGHAFVGWNTSTDGAGDDYAPGALYTANSELTLYPKWEVQSYNVSFNGNGSEPGSMAPQSMVFETTANLTPNGFTRAGFNFAGWSTNATGAVEYANGAIFTMNTEGITLYAQWTTLPTYNITYNTNNESGGSLPALQTKTQGVGLLLANNTGNLVRTGYTFVGWNTSTDGAGDDYAPGALYTANSDLTLYPEWAVQSYNVTFDGNGSAAGSMAPQSIVFEDSENLNANGFTRAGFNFAGWSTNATGAVEYANGAIFTMNTEGITLYAQWTTLPTYNITYNTNNESGGSLPALQTKTQGIGLTLATNSGNLVRTGHAFDGWNTNTDGTGTNYSEGALYTIDSDLTLYPKWTVQSYNVTFNGNGSDPGSSMTPQSMVFETTANLTANGFTRAGFNFAGWSTSATGAVEFANGVSYTMTTEGVTLYAVWNTIPPTFTFTASSGSGSESEPSPSSVITVTASPTPGSGQTYSVSYTVGGTAAGSDYSIDNGTLTFDEANTSRTISLIINDDELSEADETVSFELTNPTGGAAIGSIPIFTYTIIDDEKILYVKKDAVGGNDGTTWSNAYTDLQSALTWAKNNSGQVASIWVAKGTYNPPKNGNDTTFMLINNVPLYGGFSGTETRVDQRNVNPETNGTVLSGDLDYDGTFAGNSAHVVTASDKSTLDGFTVRDAADRSYCATYDGVDLTISNCKFTNNNCSSGYEGSSIYLWSASPVISNCSFVPSSGEKRTTLYFAYCTPVINSSSFSTASATLDASVIHSSASDLTISNSTFSNLPCEVIYSNDSKGSIVITNTKFTGCKQAVFATPKTYLTNCSFKNMNNLEESYVPVSLGDCSESIISKCTFENCTGYYAGAIVVSNFQTPATLHRIENCVFFNNTGTYGGAIQGQKTVLQITNCSFSKNTETAGANYAGSSVTLSYTTSATISNSISWYNLPVNNDFNVENGSTLNVSYSNIEQGGYDGNNNNVTCVPYSSPTSVSEMRLAESASCCINNANTAVAPTDDRDSKPRGSQPDRGAYEY